MGQIALWNNHSFTVSPTLIRGFTGLTITSGSETEEKTSSSQNYVYRKNGAPSEVALTAELNALTGCDVKTEALKFVEEANAGAQGYFYIGGKKLLTCQLMLTKAQVSEVVLAPDGVWISCKVALTMLQSSKMDGTAGSTASSSSSSGSGKTSVKYTTVQKVPVVSKTSNETTTVGKALQDAKTNPSTISSVTWGSKNTTAAPIQKVSGAAAVNGIKQSSALATAAKAVTSAAKKVSTTAASKLSVGKVKPTAVALSR